MIKKKQVVESYNREPPKENLWLKNGELYRFSNGFWELVKARGLIID